MHLLRLVWKHNSEAEIDFYLVWLIFLFRPLLITIKLLFVSILDIMEYLLFYETISYVSLRG